MLRFNKYFFTHLISRIDLAFLYKACSRYGCFVVGVHASI